MWQTVPDPSPVGSVYAYLSPTAHRPYPIVYLVALFPTQFPNVFHAEMLTKSEASSFPAHTNVVL